MFVAKTYKKGMILWIPTLPIVTGPIPDLSVQITSQKSQGNIWVIAIFLSKPGSTKQTQLASP